MPSISYKFHFHPAGQGLFYSGHFSEKGQDVFNFVYDCGSYPPTQKRLSQYIKEYFIPNLLPRKRLNLLIISHFDYDHISGLKTIFDQGVIIDNVVIPYLTPIGRLTLITQFDRTRGNRASTAWYLRFIQDPYGYLSRLQNVQRISVIGDNGEDDWITNQGENPPPTDNNRVNEDDRSGTNQLGNNERLRKQLFNAEHISGSKVSAKSEGTAIVNHVWEFKYWFHSPGRKALTNFYTEIKKHGVSMSTRINVDTLKAIVRAPTKLNKLKALYELYGKGINNTSLLLYHGPSAKTKIYWPIIVSNYKWLAEAINDLSLSDYYPGHFLTGDINLNVSYTDLAAYFQNEIPKMGFILVPHHGAAGNWNDNMIDDFQLDKNGRRYWIASAGIRRPYPGRRGKGKGHPHDEVVNAIQNRFPHHKFIWCHDYNPVRIWGMLTTL